jgi:hypothetical protein
MLASNHLTMRFNTEDARWGETYLKLGEYKVITAKTKREQNKDIKVIADNKRA